MKMAFDSITFILTDDCNFSCSYCFQTKEKLYMKRSTLEKAIPFFYPFLNENARVAFFGGEPMLAFEHIKYAVSLIADLEKTGRKNLEYSMTTNGSLITGESLDFFDSYGFFLMLSFDGVDHEINRSPGSGILIKQLVERITNGDYPGIKLATNSVFPPGSIRQLTQSLKTIIESGVTDVQFSLDENEPWDDQALSALEEEMQRLNGYLVSLYKKTGIIPVSGYIPNEPKKTPGRKEDRKVFVCAGGNNRVTVTPEENIWHCMHFHSYFKDKKDNAEFRNYSLGKLDDFMTNHETLYARMLRKIRLFRQDFFFTEKKYCFLCEDVENCGVCPLYAASITSFIGEIPVWMCRIFKIRFKEKNKLFRMIDNIDKTGHTNNKNLIELGSKEE